MVAPRATSWSVFMQHFDSFRRLIRTTQVLKTHPDDNIGHQRSCKTSIIANQTRRAGRTCLPDNGPIPNDDRRTTPDATSFLIRLVEKFSSLLFCSFSPPLPSSTFILLISSAFLSTAPCGSRVLHRSEMERAPTLLRNMKSLHKV